LAGATNTPIAASIMALEVFGPAIGPYAAVACIVSYLMTGHRSVYPSQILMIRKSASLHTETGREIHQARPSYTHRSHTIAAFLLTLWQKLATRWKKRS
jgi:H+/Cl- antiporter ClcA